MGSAAFAARLGYSTFLKHEQVPVTVCTRRANGPRAYKRDRRDIRQQLAQAPNRRL
jgi:hypothetical protein